MERRQTTLEVDRVYSLLGILDIKIPLFKDTEAATAFERLREVIEKREKCVKDLRLTDPYHDKKRIEDTKGGLLEDSYCWILENSELKQWRRPSRPGFYGLRATPAKARRCYSVALSTSWSNHQSRWLFCPTSSARLTIHELIALLLCYEASYICL
jgi:hypothetical protein